VPRPPKIAAPAIAATAPAELDEAADVAAAAERGRQRSGDDARRRDSADEQLRRGRPARACTYEHLLGRRQLAPLVLDDGRRDDRLRRHRRQHGPQARPQDGVPALQPRALGRAPPVAKEVVRIGAVSRKCGDADRKRDADVLARALRPDRRVRNRLADALRDLLRVRQTRLRQDDRELGTGRPRREVVLAQVLADQVGDAHQHSVAREVAVRRVDALEEIERDDEDGERAAEPPRTRQLLRQRFTEVARVRETGLRIRASLFAELRQMEREVKQEDRPERERQEVRVPVPEAREGDAEAREARVCCDRRRAEDLARPVAACEIEDDGEAEVVDDDERRGRRRGSRRPAPVRGAHAVDEPRDAPRAHDG
jgi:hypothetical protein